MELMDNRIRPYAWGSRSAIAELQGRPVPSPHPEAELWMGAHPSEPSRLPGSDRSLDEVIGDDPDAALGHRVAAEFGGRLPFLFKVLAAAEPLSLQAHPTPEQARTGYAAEEAAGVPLSAHRRNYKDTSAKPELICALTEFHALCGFRDPATSVRLLAALQAPALDHYLTLLSGQPDAAGLRALFSSLLTVPTAVLEPLLAQVLDACVARLRDGSAEPFVAEYRTTLELGERYPGDAGVLAALLLNRITLQPGQAVYLGAGNLHAYLSGLGVEIMANSDNVLRGGLTSKHVDMPELMRVLDFSAGPVPVLSGDEVGGERVFRTPAPEFRLSRIELTGDRPFLLDHDGPQIVLAAAGSPAVTDGHGARIDLPPGHSVWVSARERGVHLTGAGVVFRATDGLD